MSLFGLYNVYMICSILPCDKDEVLVENTKTRLSGSRASYFPKCAESDASGALSFACVIHGEI